MPTLLLCALPYGVVFYAFMLYLLIRPYWRVMVTRYGSARRLQFTLTDCWAAMFGLCPTAWVAALMLSRPGTGEFSTSRLVAAILVTIFVAANQVAGMIISLATGLSAGEAERRSFTSALWVIGGALVGLLLPVVGPIIIVLNRGDRKEREAAQARRRHLVEPGRVHRHKRRGGERTPEPGHGA